MTKEKKIIILLIFPSVIHTNERQTTQLLFHCLILNVYDINLSQLQLTSKQANEKAGNRNEESIHHL